MNWLVWPGVSCFDGGTGVVWCDTGGGGWGGVVWGGR